MKILKEKYPLRSLKGQKTAGRYINEILYENLKILAKKIVDDMTFLGVCFSSTLEVGTGKSVLMTQIGEAWTDLIYQLHGIKLPFDKNNLVWRPKDLMQRAFEVPKYSFILVDEWEDAHYWSELGMTLRQFFRKCRQLNLFIMIIIPNFFQLPMPYAVGRSIFAIDVRFGEGFERGFFKFYDFEKKKDLYLKGRREHNYHIIHSSFDGEFNDGYGIDRDEYLKAKKEDLERYEEGEKPDVTMSEPEIRNKYIIKFRENCPEIPIRLICKGFGISEARYYEIKDKQKNSISLPLKCAAVI